MNKKYLIAFVFYMLCFGLKSQVGEFQYRQKILDVDTGWYILPLPAEIYPLLSKEVHDLRIFGLQNGDTLEAPYLMELMEERTLKQSFDFKVLNESQTKEGFFYTFELPEQVDINQLSLDFQQKNFDWRVGLYGSHDMEKWFAILKDFRILSIQNEYTNYAFTDLNFPTARYPYYQLQIKSSEKPKLTSAQTSNVASLPAEKVELEGFEWEANENSKQQQTEILLQWANEVEVSALFFKVAGQNEYYRSLSIHKLLDSTPTTKGMQYHYQKLSAATITSLEENSFTFTPERAKVLKVIIENQDNAPLQIQEVKAHTFRRSLRLRFSEAAEYYLYYGNDKISSPQYDLVYFANKNTNALPKLALAEREKLKASAQVKEKGEEWSIDKGWLWFLMLAVLFLMAFYAFRMLRE